MNRKLTDIDKAGIWAARTAGMGMSEIAAKFEISRQTVYNTIKAFRGSLKDSKVADDINIGGADWRGHQVVRAVKAVNRALEDDSDVYKAAGIGVQALKGLGAYSPDQVNQVGVLIATMPADIKAELGTGQAYDFPKDPDEIQ